MTKKITDRPLLPAGRPSKYKAEFCQVALEFFDRPAFSVLKDSETDATIYDKEGRPVMVPCVLPLKEDLARKLGVHRETLLNWADEYPEFFDAIKRGEDRQKSILIHNGLAGLYDRASWIFTAKNITDMRDNQGRDLSGEIIINRIDADPDDLNL